MGIFYRRKARMHGGPQSELPAGTHLLEVQRVIYSGPKGVSVRVRYHRGNSPATALWFSWNGADSPHFTKNLWLLAHGSTGPGRYGDPVVLYVNHFEWWQTEPILEYL